MENTSRLRFYSSPIKRGHGDACKKITKRVNLSFWNSIREFKKPFLHSYISHNFLTIFTFAYGQPQGIFLRLSRELDIKPTRKKMTLTRHTNNKRRMK